MELDYAQIFHRLNQSGLDYVVVGGIAVNLHGVPRMTYDIDIMILLEKENVHILLDTLDSMGFKPKIPVNSKDLADPKKREQWIAEKQLKSFSFYNVSNAISELDILLTSPVPYQTVENSPPAALLQKVQILTYFKYASALNFFCALPAGFLNGLLTPNT